MPQTLPTELNRPSTSTVNFIYTENYICVFIYVYNLYKYKFYLYKFIYKFYVYKNDKIHVYVYIEFR